MDNQESAPVCDNCGLTMIISSCANHRSHERCNGCGFCVDCDDYSRQGDDTCSRCGKLFAITFCGECKEMRLCRKCLWCFHCCEDYSTGSDEPAPTKTDDPISPSHYQQGGMQTIDYIRHTTNLFELSNVIKYMSRYPLKNGIDDVKKAKKYLEMAVEPLSGGIMNHFSHLEDGDEDYIRSLGIAEQWHRAEVITLASCAMAYGDYEVRFARMMWHIDKLIDLLEGEK